MMTSKNPNDSYNLKLQLTQELERAVRGQKLNQELYDYLISTIQYVFEHAKDSQIEVPRPTNLVYSLDRIHALMDAVDANHFTSNRHLTGKKNYRRPNSSLTQ